MTQTEELQGSEPAAEAPKRRAKMSLDESSKGSDSKNSAPAEKPAEDVQTRLQQAADRCVSSYKAWSKGSEGEGELSNSLHELRRVLARIEIEIASSHADEGAQRAIPIPMHRAHQRES